MRPPFVLALASGLAVTAPGGAPGAVGASPAVAVTSPAFEDAGNGGSVPAEERPPLVRVRLGPVTVDLHAAIGAEWLAWVGDESDPTRFDPAAAETVRLGPSALEIELSAPHGFRAAARVEEGLIHGGELEATEAHVGWRHPRGFAEAWIGRSDLGFARDRDTEGEGHVLTVRPVLSRSLLPFHVNGVGLGAAWPERATVLGGIGYPSGVADAPWVWGRLRVHPLGELPDEEDAPVRGVRAQVGGGIAWRDSESLGESLVATADATVHVGPAAVSASWTRTFLAGEPRQAFTVEAGSRVAPLPYGDIHLHARVERVTGLEEGEDVRWVPAGRLAWRTPGRRVEVYAQAVVPIGMGDAAAEGEDVVVLDGGIDRRDEVVSVGAFARF